MMNLFPQVDVNTDYFTDNNAAGVGGGDPFTFIELDKGATLNRIKTWTNSYIISGVEVWLTDGSISSEGKCAGDSKEFSFESGELITSIKIKGVQFPPPVLPDLFRLYSGNRLTENRNKRLGVGAIMFETNHDRKWEMSTTYAMGNYWPEVGSGICCGIFGSTGSSGINRIGFAMLRKCERIIFTNVTYPNPQNDIIGMKEELVARQRFNNGTERDQTFRLSGSKTVTLVHEWTFSNTFTFSLNIDFKAGIPWIATNETKITLTDGVTTSYKRSSTASETKSWDWPVVCPLKRRTLGEIIMCKENISKDYNADLELHLDNGKVCRLKITGKYQGISVSSEITIKDLGPYEEK